MPEPSPHREEIIEALKAGEPIGEVAQRFPVARRTIERYAKQLKEGKLEEKPRKKEGGKLATVTAKQPAPVIFTIGDLQVELEPKDLFESYIVYSDLKARGVVAQDSFAKVLKGCILYAWARFVAHPVVEGDRVILTEAKHG